MEPVFHNVSLLQVHCKDMNQSLRTAYYISDQESDSNESDVLPVQDSGDAAVPTNPFTPISTGDPAKQLQRAQSAIRRRYYRRSETLFKKLAEMTTQTGWTGFLVLRSPDGGQYLYGGGKGADWPIHGSSAPDWCCAHQGQQFSCVHDQGHGQSGENREG